MSLTTPGYLRHGIRMAQQTVVGHVRACLVDGGWMDTLRPYGAKEVSFEERRVDEAQMKSVTANWVGCSFGDEDSLVPEELGGGLVSVSTPLFVDVYGENDGIGTALATDIKDWLSGAVPGVSPFVPVLDFRLDVPTAVDGHQLEFEDVIRRRPDSPDFRRLWHIVNATVVWRYVPAGAVDA